MGPNQVGLRALHHFGVNVNPPRGTSTERGFDQKSTGTCHRIDQRAVGYGPGGEVDGQTGQHRVETDGLEVRAFCSTPFTVGKRCLTVALHPPQSEGLVRTVCNKGQHMFGVFKVDRMTHLAQDASEAAGEFREAPTWNFPSLLPRSNGHRSFNTMGLEVALHGVHEACLVTGCCLMNDGAQKKTLESACELQSC